MKNNNNHRNSRMITALVLFLFYGFSHMAVHARPNNDIFDIESNNNTAELRKYKEIVKDDLSAREILTALTTDIGQRMPGTKAEARARAWAIDHLKKLGFSNVREENFDMPTWVRGEEKALIISPAQQALHISALGNSASTGKEGLTGNMLYFRTYAEFLAAPAKAIKGQIIFVDHDMRPSQDGSGYGEYGPIRWYGPNEAAKRGAAAYLLRSVGTDNHRLAHTGNTNFDEGVKPIPAAAVSNPDADIIRHLAIRHDGVMTIQLLLTPQNIGMQESGNVIAEFKGSNPNLPIIVAACHIDSWDNGTGAIDDASGCAIITAAAYRLKESGFKPKRTIRLLWAGAEEVGIWGGKDYAKRYADAEHGLAMESDFGADRVWRVQFDMPESAKPLEDRIAHMLNEIGIIRNALPARGGADVRPIITAQKPSVIDLNQDGTRYFDLHHTADDTLDKVDFEQVAQNVLAWTIVLHMVGDSELSLRRARP